ncbi:MAG: hypothetical protein OEY11_12730, partial [Gammaproteobacteria bacterium]|nr:hypothetical protein [Gammaproteobacteria bacterium]
WKKIHSRDVKTHAPVRLYSSYFAGQYSPDSEKIAEALTGQAAQTIDFPKIVRQVYDSGVRIFIEHGPRDSLCRSIKDILSEHELKNTLILPMDEFSKNACNTLYKNTIELWCSGQTISLENFKLKNNNKISKLGFDIRKPDIKFSSAVTQDTLRPIHDSADVTDAIQQKNQGNSNTTAALNSRTMPPAPKLRNLNASFNTSAKIQLESRETQQHNNLLADSRHSLLRHIMEQQTQIHTEYLQTQLENFQIYNHNLEKQIHTLIKPQPVNSTAASAAVQIKHNSNNPIQNIISTALTEEHAQADSTVKINKPKPEVIESTSANSYDYNPSGPAFSRHQLEILSSSKISSVLGKAFEAQDDYAIQVRMPEPPLLLCDRVTGIDAVAKSMQKGTIWTETDVTATSWYTHHGYMPAGIFIEAGQADLLLISYLGVDFKNKGKRAYRLLGCELEIFGDLPKVGDTLQYKICVDGHAQSGDVRLFFFHYDCYINGIKRIQVRNGQAGFFSHEELSEASGVLWHADNASYTTTAIPAPPVALSSTAYSPLQIKKYLNGDFVGCFGEDFFWTQTHTRTPTTATEKMNFIQEITEINSEGGPAGRGYLKATSRISPDDWYFEGHFKNDPCMPGTLMAEGCIQMMSFYLIALGYTLKSDGWRFQPATNSNYKFDCRGQVTPQSEELIYELFIDDIILDPHPTLYAHVLCTVDGRKAFLCERLGVELVPDWPLSEYLLNTTDTKLENCVEYNGFKFDYQSLLNCALGKPSNAFGDCYQIYDDGIRSSRLPGPPYHFMSRITELKAEFGNPYNQPSVTAEYTVSKDQWFFKENGSNSMPYCVLMEIALQPCGWLDSFCRDSEIAGEELLYRNLDGFNAIQHIELPQADYTFTTKVNMVSASRTASLIINRFKVETFANDKLAYSYETAFGFFPLESMANQRGLKISQTDQLLYEQASNIDITLTSHPLEYFNRTGPSLPKSKLLMLDRIVYFDQEGGENKKGYMRCEKDVNPKDWFFKAHFFQDPVQPGSLGVEAILQLMQLYMLKRHPEYCQSGMQFEPIIIGEAIEWHYRGQVTPEKELISVDIEVTEETDDKNSYLLWARAKLWVDGLKIYELPKIGMRLKNSAASDRVKYSHWKIDSVTSPWVLDHCPTYCRPSLPFTYLIELACSATECNLDRHGIHFDNIEIKTWMDFQTVVNPDSDSSYYEIEGEIKTTETSQHNFEFTVSKNQQHRSVFDSTTEALICGTGSYRFLDKSSPIRFPEASELKDIKASSLPYDNHEFFHGKSFQLLNKLEIGSNGSRAEIKTLSQEMQHDISGFAILDSVIQSIPNSNLSQWYPQLNTDLIAYPCQMHDLTLLESLVTENILKTESRFIEVINNRYIKIAVWIYNADRVIGYFVLTQVLVSKGITKAMTTEQRYDFIVRKIPLAEQKVLRKSPCGKSFSLEFDDIQSTDWLSGTLEAIYSLPDELSLKDKTRAILLKEYIASQKKCHPATVSLNYGLYKNADYLEQNFGIIINNRSTGLDLSSARAIAAVEFETKTIDIASLMTERGFRENLFNDLIVGLYEKFVDVIMFEDIDDFNNTGNAIYLANHQVAIESFLFAAQTYAIKGERLSTISKAENSEHWLGKIQKLAQDLYQDKNPLDILYFNRQSPDQLIDIVKQFIKNSKNSKKSLFVHAGGTREQYENQGIGQMSSFILDQAVENKTPVIPVLFLNGLPETDKGVKFELPYQLTKQTYLYGKSIQPEELKPLNAKERIEYFQQRLADLKSQYCSQKQATMNINNEQNHEIQHMAEQHDISLFAASCIYILLNKENASSETVDFINSMQGNVDKMVNNLPIL